MHVEGVCILSYDEMYWALLLITTDKYIAPTCWNKLTALPCFYVINEVFAVCCGVIFKGVWSGKPLIEWQVVIVHPFLESLVQKWTGLDPNPRPGEGGQFPENPPAAPAVTARLCTRLSALRREIFLAHCPLLCRCFREWLKGKVPFSPLLLRKEQREGNRKLWWFDLPVSYSSCINTPEYVSKWN